MIVRKRLDPALQWFAEARFGMFVHFGLYSLLGRGEWVMYHENIPREEYGKLLQRFNPRRFDAYEWIDTAYAAGARYMVVTAKHHDGFCLFDSELTDFKITCTPFGRDLIGELISACHRKKMPIVLYYSQPDWHHPNFVHRPGAFKDLQYSRPDDDPDWDKYLQYVEGQIEELCTRYGRIDGIWFDGVHKTEQEWRGRRLYRLIKRHQPEAVVNDRAGYGDFFTPERRLAAQPAAAGYMVESCQSICSDAWGYKEQATLFSSTYLIRSLVQTVAAGANYLLNIGPKPDGSMPKDQVRRLTDMGRWLAIFGDAIYGVTSCPLRSESDDVVYTKKGARVFAHLLRWPDTESVLLRHLSEMPLEARIMGSRNRARIERASEGIRLSGFPSLPVHPAVNVVELRFDTESVFRPLPRKQKAMTHEVCRDAETVLPAHTASLRGFGPKGATLQVETVRGKSSDDAPEPVTYISSWSSPEQQAVWLLECRDRVRCEVIVEMACPELYSGSTFVVRVGGAVLRGCVPPTQGSRDFRQVNLGRVDLSPGRTNLTLRPEELNYGYVFATVRRVVLRPVD